MADRLGVENPGFMAPLTRTQSPIMLPLFEDPANPGTPNPGDGGNPNPGGGGGNPNPNPNPNPAEKTFSFKEDRSDWLPRNRFNEVNTKATKAEQERDQLRGELEAERKRVAALAGVNPQDPKSKETEDIRAAMHEMFPHLKALEGLTAEQLQEVFEAAASAKTTSQASWERHAEEMFTALETEAGSKIGSEKLTPTQQRAIRRAYREEAQITLAARKKAAESGDTSYDLRGDFISRHERGDKSLIKEFVKAFMDDWYEPAVRSVTAKQAQRNSRPIPRGERTRTTFAQGAPKVDYNNESDFKKALIAARNGAQE